jgi:hypothetical protein
MSWAWRPLAGPQKALVECPLKEIFFGSKSAQRLPTDAAYFAGLGFGLGGGIESSISAQLRSSCNAACIQVLAISRNTWRCRSDLVSQTFFCELAKLFGRCRHSALPRHSHCVGSDKNVVQSFVTVCPKMTFAKTN